MSDPSRWSFCALGLAAMTAVGLASSAFGQCVVPCPPGSTIESEPCGDDTNGGCNMPQPAFEPISVGETVCGTSHSTTGGTRDTDWFEIVTVQPMVFTWTVEAEFEVVGGYIPTSPVPGLGDCNTITVLDPYIVGAPCVQVSITTECLPPGTHWFFVAPPLDSNVVCGVSNDYVATLTGQVCTLPIGACCLPDLSCVDGLTEIQCVMDNGGVFMGGGTDCSTVTCMARPCPTEPSSILLEQMDNPDVMLGNGIACGDGIDTTDNGYARTYDLSVGPTAGEVFTVTCVEMGIESSGAIDQPATLNIYEDTNGGAPTSPTSDLNLLGTQDVIIPADISGEVLGFVLAMPVQVPADAVMVVELFVYDTGTNGGIWPGTNDGTESSPSYIRAEDCGTPNFATYASLGFPNVKLVQTVIGVSGVPAVRMTLFGENYDPAQPIVDPTQYPLQELGPEFGTMWDVVEFIDLNGNNQLDTDDQLRLDDGADEISLWTTETLKACLVLEPDDPSPPAEWVYIVYEGTWTGNPIGPYREVYPQFGSLWVILEWIDNGNGIVDLCDWFNIEPPGGGQVFRHAAALGTNISVREEGGPNPCPEDINGDNVVDVLDLLAILAAWGAAGGPADINGDGIVDVLDLLAVLAAWGPCP